MKYLQRSPLRIGVHQTTSAYTITMPSVVQMRMPSFINSASLFEREPVYLLVIMDKGESHVCQNGLD